MGRLTVIKTQNARAIQRLNFQLVEMDKAIVEEYDVSYGCDFTPLVLARNSFAECPRLGVGQQALVRYGIIR